MGHVVCSIDLGATTSEVFELVKDLEKVIEFMPSNWEVMVERLTDEKIGLGLGSKYQVTIKRGVFSIEYVEVVLKLEEDKEIFSKSIEGFDFTSLKWLIEPVEDMTRLTRDVSFRMPYSFLGWVMERLWAEKTFRKVGVDWLHNIQRHFQGKPSL